MPQYRVEISPNNRATCKDTVCKKEQVKITKGEIRFGSWVEVQEHGSWSWKHWGCVSGSQLQNLRDECDKGDGEWDFDTIDGYDELTQKIRRCVKQAHIDPEDFKGDPEKNRPGEKGIHLTAKQKAAKAAAAETEEDEPEAAKPKKATKRGRKKADDDEEDDEKPKAKKSKTAKPSKSSKADMPVPAAKSRGRKAAVKEVSEEEDGGEEEEEEETEEEKPAPKKSKAKSKAANTKGSAKGNRQAAKKAAVDEDSADEKPVSKAKGRRSSRSTKA
ncbi:hypothetical protein C2857_003798 [Epichloe festucae Fl1]|uniref:PARP-type domain-containing protein n=1 Tax=Epichloe festucae (strain Fl1) TaxID=877507 RepID=A0A7S9KNX3_EPIFF|nr:hypothetical protein C2857_003798 [Epichloe festucae Fl1]